MGRSSRTGSTEKVDRLASRLGVTRGGFYHNFRDRDDLLDQLIALWERTCRFLPDDQPGGRPSEAADWLDRVFSRLIDFDDYDHRFDLAVRDWARADQRAARALPSGLPPDQSALAAAMS